MCAEEREGSKGTCACNISNGQRVPGNFFAQKDVTTCVDAENAPAYRDTSSKSIVISFSYLIESVGKGGKVSGSFLSTILGNNFLVLLLALPEASERLDTSSSTPINNGFDDI